MSFLFGVILNVYDDIIDNKLDINTTITDFFCYASITLQAILCYKSPYFSVILAIMSGISAIMDYFYTRMLKKETYDSKDLTCMNDSFFIYLLCLSIMFTFYHFSNKSIYFNKKDQKTASFYNFAIINLLIAVADIYFTPEHSSRKKFYARLMMLFVVSTIVFYMIKYKDHFHNGVIGIMLMNLGILIWSVIYFLLENTSIITNLKPKIKKKKKSKHKKVINRKKL